MSYPIRCGAPVARVSQELRGPPCISITRSKRAARSRRASRQSSSSRRTPRVLGTTITSSRCGLPMTTLAASRSTRYVRRASGKVRFSLRNSGVVNTTSPMRRRRITRMFTSRFDRGLVQQHDRNVVLDRIHALALAALERAAVLHEIDLGLAVRAGQDLEQFGVYGHRR